MSAKVPASPIVAHRPAEGFPGRDAEGRPAERSGPLPKGVFCSLCPVEGHMLMNGGRREAIKGSSWPLAAESALGAGSGAAVPLFRTKPRPGA